jgi:hypothetical protein
MPWRFYVKEIRTGEIHCSRSERRAGGSDVQFLTWHPKQKLHFYRRFSLAKL